MRLGLATLILILLALPLRAQHLCGISGAALADQVNGTWQLSVVAAKMRAGKITSDVPKGSTEVVTMTLSPSGTGQMRIKGGVLRLVAQPIGVDIRQKTDHFAAFKAASGTLRLPQTAGVQGCDIKTIPHLSAELAQGGASGARENRVELVLMGDGLFAGAQVVEVPGETVSQGAPDIRITSAVVLRRLSGGGS